MPIYIQALKHKIKHIWIHLNIRPHRINTILPIKIWFQPNLKNIRLTNKAFKTHTPTYTYATPRIRFRINFDEPNRNLK